MSKYICIAINKYLLSEIKAYSELINSSTTQILIDVAFLGSLRWFILTYPSTNKDIVEKHVLEYIQTTFKPIPQEITIYPDKNRGFLFNPNKFKFINFIKIAFTENYSTSKIFNYVLALGIDQLISYGYFKPKNHINFVLDESMMN